jgi:hypothetical protein
MGEPRRVDLDALRRVLMEHEGNVGVFEHVIGFRPATASGYKAVHLMNDLAQCALGGAPQHGGDLLARVIRTDIEGEDNRESTMRADERFGAAFDLAYPSELGRERVEALRVAAREVLAFDKGVYQPGTSMCSPLATHRDLLGFEQFRRFGVGRLLADVLPPEGLAKMREHMLSEGDPLTRAFRPLLLAAPLVDKQKPAQPVERSPFDRDLGAALTTLMGQPLSKPTMLRTVALGSCLGLVLKILGAGREGGRPALLALPNAEERGPKALREEAVASFRRGVDSLDRRVASLVPAHKLAPELMKKGGARAPCVEVPDTRKLDALAAAVIPAARAAKGYDEIYWPDDFAVKIGRKAGCVLPLSDRAGWGRHLALSPELVEVLVLMHVASGAPPLPWSRFWAKVRDELGVVVGANATEDIAFLARAGVESVSDESLADNAEAILSHAVRRGVARRLPDGEAEVGGDLS